MTATSALHFKQREYRFQAIGFGTRLIPPPAMYSGETNCDAGFMPLGPAYSLKGNFKNQLGFNHTHRSMALQGVLPNPSVHLPDLFIG